MAYAHWRERGYPQTRPESSSSHCPPPTGTPQRAQWTGGGTQAARDSKSRQLSRDAVHPALHPWESWWRLRNRCGPCSEMHDMLQDTLYPCS